MVTYNVKTAAAMLGRSQTFVITKAWRLQLRPPGQSGPWYFTDEQVKMIRTVGPKIKVSKLRMIALANNMKQSAVKKVIFNCRLTLTNDYDKIMKGCRLFKKGEYTWKGIRKRLGIKALEI
jgi:hypothetical protein